MLYTSLSKICNVSVKSITDPQYYKNVILFINTAISSGKFVLADTDAVTVNGDDNLLDISIVEDIFKAARGDIRALVPIAKKYLPEEYKNKIILMEKLIDEIESFAVFGKT